MPPLSYDGLGHTSRTFRKIYQSDTLEKNGLAQLPYLPPSTIGSNSKGGVLVLQVAPVT